MHKIYLCPAFMHLWSAEAFKFQKHVISIVLSFLGHPVYEIYEKHLYLIKSTGLLVS